MAYSTAAEVRAALPAAFLDQLTDDASGVLLDDAVIENAISFADAEINLYLGRMRVVPLVDVPDSINRLSVRLARYFLYVRRGLEEDFQADYQSCVKILEGIASGEVTIEPPPDDPDDPNPGPAWLRFYAI
jgi:phage gp36-like protein